MKRRALILAIEDYPDSRVTSVCLPGTIAGAERFARWLEASLEMPRQNIHFCCTGKSEFPTKGAKRQEIKTAIVDLLKESTEGIDELYVYVAAHGVLKLRPDLEPHTDVILCADFVTACLSGDTCIPLDELTTFLSRFLGAKTIVCFVDICRTTADQLIPVSLGINCGNPIGDPAAWFQLLSSKAGEVAISDSVFLDAVLAGLNGNCVLEQEAKTPGTYWVTFNRVAQSVAKCLKSKNREIDVRSSGKPDTRIRSLRQPGPTATIVTRDGTKSPPVELLIAHDEIIFMGETNGQLPSLLEQAFKERQQRRWKRLDILSIDDLSTSHRKQISLMDLEQEREEAEVLFRQLAQDVTDELQLYRYHYVGTYGSFWTAADGTRRAHLSAKILGEDIRNTPGNDFLDFPEARDATVDRYFQLAQAAITHNNTRLIFQFPEPLKG